MGAVSSRRRVKPGCAQAPAAGKNPPAWGAFRPVAGTGLCSRSWEYVPLEAAPCAKGGRGRIYLKKGMTT